MIWDGGVRVGDARTAICDDCGRLELGPFQFAVTGTGVQPFDDGRITEPTAE